MKRVFLASLLVLQALARNRMLQNIRSNFGTNRFLSVPKSEVSDIVNEIFDEFHADQLGHQDGNLHLKVPAAMVDALVEEGVKFEDHTETFISNMERNLNSANFFCSETSENCANKELDDFHSTYQDYDAIHARFEKIHAENPELTKLEELGKSHYDRSVKLLWIGDDGEKPLVYYFCTMHAREWIVPMYCTYMAEMLTDGSAQSQELLSKFTFAITPIANPDGYVYSFEENNAWRKTTKPNPGSSCIGTDGNRNYATGWGGPGSSSRACSDTYKGEAPFDQPATANVKAFTDAHEDRIIHINDVHSYGEYFLSPLSGTSQLPPDAAKHAECSREVHDAIKAATGLSFKTGPSAVTLYTAAGASMDYFYTENNIVHTYLYEARGGGRSGIAGFQPPVSNIMPSNIELYAGFVAVMNCVERQELQRVAPADLSCFDLKTTCTANSCLFDKESCQKTCGMCPGLDRSGDESAGVDTEVASTADLQPLIGAVVFLGMMVAVLGTVLVFIVQKLKKENQESTPTEVVNSKLPPGTHYQLN